MTSKKRFAVIALCIFLMYALLFVLAQGKAEVYMVTDLQTFTQNTADSLNLNYTAPSQVLKTSGSQVLECTVLAALVSVLCLSIAYGISVIFGLNWEMTIKSEMVSVMLVVAFAGFCYGGGLLWLLDLLGLDYIYREAFDFLITVVRHIMEAQILAITIYTLAAVAKGVADSIAHIPLVGGALYFLVAAPEAQANLIQNYIMKSVLPSLRLPLMMVFMHISLLEIGALSTKVFLPAGLIMRVLPPTRIAGAFLIALTVALWAVFPFTIVYVYKPMYEEADKTAIDTAKGELQRWIDELKNKKDDILQSIESGNIGQPLVTGFAAVLDAVITPMITFFTLFIALLYTRWVLIPFVNLILLILLVASLTEMMGEGGIITRMVYKLMRIPK